jgi:hypothetical protein
MPFFCTRKKCVKVIEPRPYQTRRRTPSRASASYSPSVRAPSSIVASVETRRAAALATMTRLTKKLGKITEPAKKRQILSLLKNTLKRMPGGDQRRFPPLSSIRPVDATHLQKTIKRLEKTVNKEMKKSMRYKRKNYNTILNNRLLLQSFQDNLKTIKNNKSYHLTPIVEEEPI